MAATATRRPLRFNHVDEILAEVERLAAGKVKTSGNWTFPQILDHLTKSMNATIDGFGFQAPWIARKIIAPLLKNSIITKGMRAGFKLPADGQGLIPDPQIDLATALEQYRKAFARLKTEKKREPHPFLGSLSSQEYESLNMRHSELHLSFVESDETA